MYIFFCHDIISLIISVKFNQKNSFSSFLENLQLAFFICITFEVRKKYNNLVMYMVLVTIVYRIKL